MTHDVGGGIATAPRRVLLATRNPGKLRELAPLLAALGCETETLVDVGLVETAAEEALEVHPTFADNALAKARYFHRLSGGRLVLAEDSGLCVAALDGAPGVLSKRWGALGGLEGGALEQSNTERLLGRLQGESDRRAWYACSAAIVWAGGEVVADGASHGRLLEAPCGTGGFGYDPIFWSDELDACFGAVSSSAKAGVSHRARALAAVWTAYQAAATTISA